jgi:uncharacterized lipoprotein YddW (UPF0748 family)
VQTLVLALAVCVVCVVQASDIVVVRGTYAEAVKSPEAPGTVHLYEVVAHAMQAAGLDFTTLHDEQAASGGLAGAKLAVFPYTPVWAPGEAEAAISFVRAGGKVVVCYLCPPELAQALGFKLADYIADRDRQGKFDHCRLAKTAPAIVGLPQRFAQESWNITSAVPDRADAVALYDWYSPKGEPSGLAAMLLSDSGAFMTHVFTEPDAAAKSQLLLALAGHFLPDLWPSAARRAIDGAWTFDAFSSAAGLEDLVAHATARGVANNPRPSLDRAKTLTAQAEQAAAEKRYPDAIALAAKVRAAAIEAYARCQSSRPVEMRATWIHTAFGVGNWGWEKSIRHLRDMGFNAILPNMCWGGVAYYQSKVLPVAPEVAKRGDQVAECLKWCRKYGVELHVWKVNWNLGGGHTPQPFREQMRRENRLQQDPAGNEIDWLCPSDDRNFALERDSMLELVRKYHVDGIHFDYIRYPDNSGCFCPRCREKFEARLGHKVEHWPDDARSGPLVVDWLNFRRDNISRLVQAVGEETRRIDPHCKVSGAVFGWWESSRDSIGQDWVLWVNNGWLDFVCPMDYIPGNQELARVVTKNARWVDGREPLYIGLGEWLLRDAAHLIYQIGQTRDLGTDGYVLFHYDHPEITGERMPMLRLGVTREPALFPHRGPSVRWQLPKGIDDAPPNTFVRGAEIAVTAALASDAPAAAFLELHRLDGSAIQPLGRASPGSSVAATFKMRAEPGRLAMVGRAADGRIVFETRGPILYAITPEAFAEQQARKHPPAFEGKGLAVGVFEDSYGGPTILAALQAMPGLEARPLYSLAPDFLKPCRVVIVPQPKSAAILSAAKADLRAFVDAGGFLLVTHDAVGFRLDPVLVPEVCAGGAERAEDNRWRLAADLPAEAGLKVGETHRHTFWDHIVLTPGPAGKIVATDAADRPLVVVGPLGTGRFCACGIALGVEREGDRDTALSDAEARLLRGLLLDATR